MIKMVCKVNMGMRMQQVLIEGRNTPGKKNIETYWMEAKKIPDFVINNEDIEEVHLFGNSKYLKRLEEETKEQELKKYNKTKLKFIYNS